MATAIFSRKILLTMCVIHVHKTIVVKIIGAEKSQKPSQNKGMQQTWKEVKVTRRLGPEQYPTTLIIPSCTSTFATNNLANINQHLNQAVDLPYYSE